jgi:hypothetical protein
MRAAVCARNVQAGFASGVFCHAAYRPDGPARAYVVKMRKTVEVYVVFEVFTAATMKNAVFWEVTPCGSCKYRSLGGTYRLHNQGDRNRRSRKGVRSN